MATVANKCITSRMCFLSQAVEVYMGWEAQAYYFIDHKEQGPAQGLTDRASACEKKQYVLIYAISLKEYDLDC